MNMDRKMVKAPFAVTVPSNEKNAEHDHGAGRRYEAFGIVEVLGQCMATVVIDQMVKSAEVTYCTMITKYGGLIAVIMSGSVSAVHAAVEAAKESLGSAVKKTLVLSNPSEETVRIVEQEILLRNGR